MTPDTTPGPAEMLALSMPSFVCAGQELARKTYLRVSLMLAARLEIGGPGAVACADVRFAAWAGM